jgi:hypothetical protein
LLHDGLHYRTNSPVDGTYTTWSQRRDLRADSMA